LTDEQLEKFAEVISWNIFQMDGIKFVIPMSCNNECIPSTSQQAIFETEQLQQELLKFPGCEHNQADKHNGKYVKVMDWTTNKPINFLNLVTEVERQVDRR
jgi:hypothetical protein